MRGAAPFILTEDNASYFFEPATLIRKTKQQWLDKLTRLSNRPGALRGLPGDLTDKGYPLKD